jgi:hypothetical protein
MDLALRRSGQEKRLARNGNKHNRDQATVTRIAAGAGLRSIFWRKR